VNIENDNKADGISLAEPSPAAARPEGVPVGRQATTDFTVELQTEEKHDEPGPGPTDALGEAEILARVLGLTEQSEGFVADKPGEGLGEREPDEGQVIAVIVDGRDGQGVRAAADDGLDKAEQPIAANSLDTVSSLADSASAQAVEVGRVDDAGLDSHQPSADSRSGAATGISGVSEAAETHASPAKPEPAAEDDSISAAFDPPATLATPDTNAPTEISIAAHVLEPAIESSSAAPSPVPSATSVPTASAPAPAEEIYGYLSGRPILGYTATGRPILGKATDARALTSSISGSSVDQSSVSAKEREKQRKAKVAAQAKEKEAAKNAKAKALVEREKEEAEAARRREKELREQTERDRKEEARVKDAERKAKEREEKEREKKEVKETKGKGGKKGKVSSPFALGISVLRVRREQGVRAG
jgi:hypothetical protein